MDNSELGLAPTCPISRHWSMCIGGGRLTAPLLSCPQNPRINNRQLPLSIRPHFPHTIFWSLSHQMATTLSLIGSIIAVVQTGDRLVSLLDKIRPFFNAPKGLNLLINEISSFKEILIDLQTALDHDVDSIPAKLLISLGRHMEGGGKVLTDLETLVDVSFVRPRGSSPVDMQQVNRIAWTKKLHEVEHLRQRVRDVKMNVLVQLGAIQM